MIEIGQYNRILVYKTKGKFAFEVLSRDRVSNIPFIMHVFMLSWDTTLSFKQYLKHLKFLEHLLGVGHEGCRDAEDGRRSILMSSKV